MSKVASRGQFCFCRKLFSCMIDGQSLSVSGSAPCCPQVVPSATMKPQPCKWWRSAHGTGRQRDVIINSCCFFFSPPSGRHLSSKDSLKYCMSETLPVADAFAGSVRTVQSEFFARLYFHEGAYRPSDPWPFSVRLNGGLSHLPCVPLVEDVESLDPNPLCGSSICWLGKVHMAAT